MTQINEPRFKRSLIDLLAPLVLVASATGCDGPSVGSGNDGEPSAPIPIAAGAGLLDRVAEAELVFHGEVVKLDYRTLTVPDVEVGKVPHTYVTYRVVEGIKGGRPGELVTLRFLGGPTDDGSLILKASEVPSFDLGDNDIVLVAGNGTGPCPLVDCAEGRFRIVDGFVYTDDGGELRLTPAGEIRRGASHALPEVTTQTIRGVQLTTESSHREAAASTAPSANALTSDDLLSMLAVVGADDVASFNAADFSVGPDAPFQP